MLALTDLLGRPVCTATGAELGRLVDLAVVIGAGHPHVQHLTVGRRREPRFHLLWTAVVALEPGSVRLAPAWVDRPGPGPAAPEDLPAGEVRLRRDVLDTQVIDVAGKRVARVSEVLLAPDGTDLRVVAVDVGQGSVWRRLGLHRLAARTPEQAVDWADVHLTSAPGHALQLATPGSGVHRLDAAELAALVAHLPADRAAQVLQAVPTHRAAGALIAAHPDLGARLLSAVDEGTASAVLEHLPPDDASSLLRRLPPATTEALLRNVVPERARALRHLLAHPAATAREVIERRRGASRPSRAHLRGRR